MKGTFFSADFVRDQNDDLRLIEINTDTGIIESQKSVFDWSEFFNILNNNAITELTVVYKHSIQYPIIESLRESLEKSAPSITLNPILSPEDSIFPPTIDDNGSTFVLRMAYDETSILDSEYAKGTLNLLKLFADAGDSQSTVNFYHSSNLNGDYNTLDIDLLNQGNIPDVIVKSTIEEHKSHGFYKIGKSELPIQNRLNSFLEEINDHNLVLQQYHYSPAAVESNNNKVSSVRSFQIVYGPNLDLCTVADYEILAVLDLPTEVGFDDKSLVNKVSNKHYYEFATNHVKNIRHGFIGDTEILDEEGNTIQIKDVKIGDKFKSYSIESAPNTDDEAIIRDWLISGNVLPEGSHETISTLVDIYSGLTYTNEMTSINFEDGEEIVIGGETRLLVYNKETNTIKYRRVLDIKTGDSILSSNGTLVTVNSIELVIFEEPQTVYALNLEEEDNFILTTKNIHGFSMSIFFTIAHNCFAAGTQIEMADGSFKNIEDIVEGDVVASFNETTREVEPKAVSNPVQTTKDNIINLYTADSKSITSTLDHPYYKADLTLASRDGSTTEGNKLEVGNSLYTRTGQATSIVEISEFSSVLLHTNPTTMYIFTVADNHNFFANGLLVHNK